MSDMINKKLLRPVYDTNEAMLFMSADAAIWNRGVVIDLTLKCEAPIVQLNASVKNYNQSHNRYHRDNCSNHKPATSK